ncbi:uncharacterized protein LOC108674802 [Hyalella azteca]|uniref:Uncharacterized protein LOC108674802 n=1 Tax=Hyalella azteca TaxID=294128 RepID=A0A8B7NZH9_HYAAZ|nr:uncharacterized protein LOC108674802 [Hyalella azteca]
MPKSLVLPAVSLLALIALLALADVPVSSSAMPTEAGRSTNSSVPHSSHGMETHSTEAPQSEHATTEPETEAPSAAKMKGMKNEGSNSRGILANLTVAEIVHQFRVEDFRKIFTYQPAPELSVPQNESIAFLSGVLKAVNANLDSMMVETAKHVAESLVQVVTAETGNEDEPDFINQLINENMKTLVSSLKDYPFLKEGIYLWLTSEDDTNDTSSGSGLSPSGRSFPFKKPDPVPKFFCPDRITELVNCWSYDILDMIADRAKDYLSPFRW